MSSKNDQYRALAREQSAAYGPMTTETRAELLLEAIEELRYRRGRLSKVTVGDLVPVLETIDRIDAARQGVVAGLDVAEEPGLRAALYREVGSRLTDVRIAELMRAASIPLHEHPMSNEAGYVAAIVRAEMKEGVDTALRVALEATGEGSDR